MSVVGAERQAACRATTGGGPPCHLEAGHEAGHQALDDQGRWWAWGGPLAAGTTLHRLPGACGATRPGVPNPCALTAGHARCHIAADEEGRVYGWEGLPQPSILMYAYKPWS